MKKNLAIKESSKVALPAITEISEPLLERLTHALGIDRSVLASNDQICNAWDNLPRLLTRIPPELRNETMLRMCIAVGTGLFDSAINYAWNASVLELRSKVRNFGLNAIRQISGKPFDEKILVDLKDADLLEMCLKYNLLSEDGYFMLSQCRDIRNNFSAAHPAVGGIDDDEFITFLSRCSKYALSQDNNPVGIEIVRFFDVVKTTKLSKEQVDTWTRKINETHEAQRDMLLVSLHGMYCDPDSGEETRLNSLKICRQQVENFTPRTRSEMIDHHEEYSIRGDDKRLSASRVFFEKLGLLSLLNKSEIHSIITSATKKLLSVHNSFDNFYNEPPFAERLANLTAQHGIPDTAQEEYVEVVVNCAIGNGYGVSNSAYPYYEKMIKSFSPQEITIMLALPQNGNTLAGRRIQGIQACKKRFKKLVELIDKESVPTQSKSLYAKILKS